MLLVLWHRLRLLAEILFTYVKASMSAIPDTHVYIYHYDEKNSALFYAKIAISSNCDGASRMFVVTRKKNLKEIADQKS